MACDSADRITAAIDSIETDAALFHNIVQGDDQTTVNTENGPVNSAAKAIRLFVDRTDWGGSYLEESTGIPGTDYDQGSFIIDDSRVGATNNIYIVELDFTSTDFATDIGAGDMKLAIEIGPLIAAAAASAAAAAVSESNAATSETNAATSAIDADDTLKEFETEYLGAFAVDPTLDNEGGALITGALYFNTVANELRVYTGAAWIQAGGSPPVVTEDCKTLTEGQTVVTGIASTENAGVYVEGVRLDSTEFTIDSDTQITLDRSYTAGNQVCIVARDFQGSPEGQGAPIFTVWEFDSATADADPGTGKFRLNNATQANATFIFISKISQSGASANPVLVALQEDDYIWIQDQANTAKGHTIKIDSGSIDDATTYLKIPIIVEESLADLVATDDTGFVFYWSSALAGIPLSHAASHQDGGSDEIATATPGADVIPKANGSGELADAFISESSVTQHEAAIDHDALLNYAVAQHRIINDSGTSTTEVFSASEIISRLAAAIEGRSFKGGVLTDSDGEGDITLSGEQTINGETTLVSDVFLTEQSAGAENGPWVTAAGAWSRPDNFNEAGEAKNGNTWMVSGPNSTSLGNRWTLITEGTIIIDTTALSFIQDGVFEFGDGVGQAIEGTNTRILTQDENDAAQGTDGSPSDANRYVTDSDNRLSLSVKAGVIPFATFAGNPKIATVTFAGAFADVNYTPAAIGGNGNVISYQSLLAASFVINLNTNTQPTVDVKWSAIEHGEN